METLWLSAADWSRRARDLRNTGWLLVDLCGVDRMHLPAPGGRFEVVVQLLHREHKERGTVHIAADGDPPTIPSVTDVWPTVDFFEREAYDMYGIVFDGHPNLTRLLMPEEWEGHPLRKDYGVGKVPVEFVPQPFLQIDTRGQGPNFEESDAPVDELGQLKERS